MYDVIVIGAGPGGIFTVYELAERAPGLKIAVFEMGHELKKRKCPIDGDKVKSCIGCSSCSIMSGFGGAGAFSDGKYNITNDFGGTLHEYIGKKTALELMEYVDGINLKFGGEGTKLYSTAGTEIKKKCLQNDLHLLNASVRHLGTDINYIVLENLYAYLKDTYGTGESDLVSAFMMDFDSDSRKDLLTVTKGRVILANTPLGAFDLYDGGTEASTLDLIMYQLDEKNSVVKTGAILGAGTIEGHSQGKMSISIILQDGKPYICGYSENEDDTTYGARPYVIYEVIEGGGFQYDYVDGIAWGQYVMGRSDDKDPNKIAGTYNLDISGTQLSERGDYGVVLCEATADNRKGPGSISATDYTHVMEGMENGYTAVKADMDAMQEEMVLDAKTFEERQKKAKETEDLFETFVSELSASGTTLTLKEYRTKEEEVTGVYTCQDVDVNVSIEVGSGKLLEIELFANGYPVPDSWYPVKDAVLTSTFAGLDQAKIGELLGRTRTNLSGRFDAGPAEILAGNAGTIVLRITYR